MYTLNKFWRFEPVGDLSSLIMYDMPTVFRPNGISSPIKLEWRVRSQGQSHIGA